MKTGYTTEEARSIAAEILHRTIQDKISNYRQTTLKNANRNIHPDADLVVLEMQEIAAKLKTI